MKTSSIYFLFNKTNKALNWEQLSGTLHVINLGAFPDGGSSSLQTYFFDLKLDPLEG